MFQPLHSAQELGGTGIGLANVRRLVRLTAAVWTEGMVSSCDLDAGAYVVKPMGYHDSVKAIEEVGHLCWGLVKQPLVRGKQR